MENINLSQIQQHIDIFNKVCKQYKIDINELAVFGRILGPNGYQGRQADVNLLINRDLDLFTVNGFQKKLQLELNRVGIPCSVNLASQNQIIKFFGLVPRVSNSNQTERSGRITKRGSKLGRTTLVQCALVAKKYSDY